MKKLIVTIVTLLSFGAISFGNTLQGVQLKDINNKPVSLNKYKGKKIYIKMWASWCPICLSGLSEINSLSADKSKNFTVITIASPGQKGEVLKRAKVLGYPSNIILDGNLNIVKTLPGHLTAAQIKGAVK